MTESACPSWPAGLTGKAHGVLGRGEAQPIRGLPFRRCLRECSHMDVSRMRAHLTPEAHWWREAPTLLSMSVCSSAVMASPPFTPAGPFAPLLI